MGRPPLGKTAMTGAERMRRLRERQNPEEVETQAAIFVLDHGMTHMEAARKAGLKGSQQVVKTAVAREQGRRQAEIQIDPTALSAAAQQKIAMAIRQHQRKLDMKLEERVQDRIDLWMEQFRPHIEDAVRIKRGRHGIITKDEANAIKRSLHPDNSAGPETRTKAFIVWRGIEHLLLTEEDAPTIVPLPPRRKAQG